MLLIFLVGSSQENKGRGLLHWSRKLGQEFPGVGAPGGRSKVSCYEVEALGSINEHNQGDLYHRFEFQIGWSSGAVTAQIWRWGNVVSIEYLLF